MLRLAIPALALMLLVSGCSLMSDKPEPAPPPPVKAVEPPPPPPPPPPLTHTLKKGETVAAVAKRYGVKAQDLLSANNLANAKAVKTGMVLTIPGQTAPDVTKPTGKIEKETPEAKEKAIKGGSKKDPFGIDAALAPDKKGKGKKGGKFLDDDATYERVKVEFHEYARKWLDKSQAMAEFTKAKKEVKLEEGRYVASYNEILLDTMETEVKRVDYDGTPYVGHITYRLRVHRTFGPTPQAAQAAQDEIVQEEFMREIFSFSSQKRAWR